jgi:hypothetical protein
MVEASFGGAMRWKWVFLMSQVRPFRSTISLCVLREGRKSLTSLT